MHHKLQAFILTLIGIGLLLGGLGMAIIAPLEIACFPMFSEGGRFYFEGFGFGSLVFAVIAWQVIGYNLIAIICIPLGYGHLKRKRWTRIAILTAVWAWIVVGAPLTLIIGAMALAFKAPSMAAITIEFPILGLLLYPIVPWIMIRFYNSLAVKDAFESQDTTPHWIESIPQPILVLAFLFAFYLIALYVPFFFNGIFPWFGMWLSAMPGMLALDATILCLAALTWGTLRRKLWAWWGDTVYFGLLTLSVVITLVQSKLTDILEGTHLAPLEVQALNNTPLQGWHLAVAIVIPLTATWGLILFSKRYFAEKKMGYCPHSMNGNEIVAKATG
jgi:hypothetical protein